MTTYTGWPLDCSCSSKLGLRKPPIALAYTRIKNWLRNKFGKNQYSLKKQKNIKGTVSLGNKLFLNSRPIHT